MRHDRRFPRSEKCFSVTLPLKALLRRYKMVRFSSLPISGGICPVSMLPPSSSLRTLVSCAIQYAVKLPVMLASDRPRSLKLHRLDQDGGSNPANLLRPAG